MEIESSIPNSAIFFWVNYDGKAKIISFHSTTGFKEHPLPAEFPQFKMPQMIRISLSEILIVDSRHYSKKKITIPIGRNLDIQMPACIFNFETNGVTQVSPYQGNNDFKLVSLNSTVYAIGYYGEILGQIWKLDLSTRKWAKLCKRTSESKKGACFVNGQEIYSIENNLKRTKIDVQKKSSEFVKNKQALTVDSPHLCSAYKSDEIIFAESKKTFWYDLKQEKIKFLHRSQGKVIGLLVEGDNVYIFDKRLSYAKYSLTSDEVVEIFDSSAVPFMNFPKLTEIDLLFNGRSRYISATSPGINVEFSNIDSESQANRQSFDNSFFFFGSEGELCLKAVDSNSDSIKKYPWHIEEDFLIQNKIDFCVQLASKSMKYYSFTHCFTLNLETIKADGLEPMLSYVNFHQQSFFGSTCALSWSISTKESNKVHKLSVLNLETGAIELIESTFKENGSFIAFTNRGKVFIADQTKKEVEFWDNKNPIKTVLKFTIENPIRYIYEASDGNVIFIDNTATVYKLWLNDGADNAEIETMDWQSNVNKQSVENLLVCTPRVQIFCRGQRLLMLLYSNAFLVLKDGWVFLVRYAEIDSQINSLANIFGSDTFLCRNRQIILAANKFCNPQTYFLL